MLTIEFAQVGIDLLLYTTVWAAGVITLYDFINGLDQLTLIDDWMSAIEQRTFQPVLPQAPQPVANIPPSTRRHNTTTPIANPVLITPAPSTSLLLPRSLKKRAAERRPQSKVGNRQANTLNSLSYSELAKLAKRHGVQIYRPGVNRRKTKPELLADLKPLVAGTSKVATG